MPMTWPRYSSGQPTHAIGEFDRTTEYGWLSGDPKANALVHPELVPVVRRAAWLLVSPLALLVSWWIGQAGIRDFVVSTQGWVLGLWTVTVIAAAVSQIASKSLRLIGFRMAMLGLLLAATAAVAIGYAYVAQTAHANARLGEPQRAFTYLAEGSKLRGLIPATYGFQLEDGSNLAGGRKRNRFEYGSCVTAQLLAGRRGFRWVHVTEWTPPPGPGQLHWPVRREDCFSDIPLSQVRR